MNFVWLWADTVSRMEGNQPDVFYWKGGAESLPINPTSSFSTFCFGGPFTTCLNVELFLTRSLNGWWEMEIPRNMKLTDLSGQIWENSWSDSWISGGTVQVVRLKQWFGSARLRPAKSIAELEDVKKPLLERLRGSWFWDSKRLQDTHQLRFRIWGRHWWTMFTNRHALSHGQTSRMDDLHEFQG